MKFLVVGLGSIGLRHARNLRSLGHKVVGIDPDESRMHEALRSGVVMDTTDDVDGVVIAAPTLHHAAMLNEYISQDKHVFVEKPIASTYAVELDKLSALANRRNLVLAVGNNMRFHPSARLTRRFIHQQLIGDVLWAHITCAQHNERPPYLRDGVTLNWGAHEIDLALWWLGPAKVVTASINADDTMADICLTHWKTTAEDSRGCQTTIHLDYHTQPELRQALFVGTAGRIVMSLPERYVVVQRGDSRLPTDKQSGSYDDDYKNEMIAFVNAVQGTAPWPGATALDAIMTLEIIDEAKVVSKWADRGNEVVYANPPANLRD